jgi:hypothetical protein
MTEQEPSKKPNANGGNLFQRIRLTNWQIILIALVVVGGRLVIDFQQRILEGQEKLAEQRRLEGRIEALLQEQRELEAAKAYYSSPTFVEAWAHNEGKMVRDGETLVVPVYVQPEQGVAVAAAPGNNPQAPLPAWQIWWALFFDSPPPPDRASQP